jgi:hypothetical protein
MIKSKIENCPVCKTKLSKGNISYTRGLRWLQENESVGIFMTGGQLLAGSTIGPTWNKVNGLRCKKCKLNLFFDQVPEK